MKKSDIIITQSTKLANYTNSITKFSYIKDSLFFKEDIYIADSANDILAIQTLTKDNSLFFTDDIVNFKLGELETICPIKSLTDLIIEDFVDEIKESKNGLVEYSLSLVEASSLRLEFEENFHELLDEWNNQINLKINKIMGGPVNNKTIYHVKFPNSEMEWVYDGHTLVAHGNSWDFHSQTDMPNSYKKIQFENNWNGAHYLSSKLSSHLNKTLKNILIKTDNDYDIFVNNTLPIRKKVKRSNFKTVATYLAEIIQKDKIKKIKENTNDLSL